MKHTVELKPLNRLISRTELCTLAGIALSTAEAWARNGIGPAPVKIGPRRVGYRMAEVDAFLEGRLQETASTPA
jgi:predicted DNA-binding transcriptional regulator AlpA